jgi:LPXTG-site transpeptidase (sortase) family protein
MTKHALNDKDLELIFSDQKTRLLNNKIYKTLKYVLAFAGICLVVFLLLNFASIKKQIEYWLMDDFASDPIAVITENPSPVVEEPTIASIPNNTIEILPIGVTAPILWDIPNTDDAVAKGLSQGVIQINGTAKPGEKGNVFITGHSSNYPWAKGNYNQIFALLDKLVIGDQIKVAYLDKTYLYTVFEKKVVLPSETSILNQTEDNRLTLMTCTPVGTNLKRLVVIATQTFPSVK